MTTGKGFSSNSFLPCKGSITPKTMEYIIPELNKVINKVMACWAWVAPLIWCFIPSWLSFAKSWNFIGLAYQGKDIVLRFIVEYNSLRDFGPLLVGQFWYKDLWKMIFWLVLKLEICCRVMISWKILVSFSGFFFEDYIFAWWNKYLNFHNSSFALKILLKCKWRRPQCHTLLVK